MTLDPGDLLRALAEPRRRAILRLVAQAELPAGDIAAAFDVTRPAISQHLTVLRTVGLLHERRDGTRRYYRTRIEALAELRALLDELDADGGAGQPREPSTDGESGVGAHSRRANTSARAGADTSRSAPCDIR